MVPLRKRRISRRALLRGTGGVALGLPWLEAMGSAKDGEGNGSGPVRLAALYMPNGAYPESWTPAEAGGDFGLTPSLEPVAPVRKHVTVLSNLWNEQAKDGDGHYVKEASILTCARIRKTQGADLRNGTSFDQVAAKARGHLTPLPSLELGVTPVAVGNDAVVGYTRVYGSHISWASPTTPLPRELNPRAAYERLFRAAHGTPSSEAELDSLLLDRVVTDAKRLRSSLAAGDKTRLDEYLSSIRSIEKRVERSSSRAGSEWTPLVPLDSRDAPTGQPSSHLEHVRLMLDVIAAAFQSDTTRIATFMFGNAVSNVSFRFLDGVTSGHHDVSHHGGKDEKLAEYKIINRWHVEQFVYLLDRLAKMREGESSVLRNSLVVFSSALSDGQKHDPHKLPVLLGGDGGGRISAGQHLVYAEDHPLADLYVSLLDAFGAPVERFADSTGTLRGLLRG